jgi:hypothetical protein
MFKRERKRERRAAELARLLVALDALSAEGRLRPWRRLAWPTYR